MITTVVVVVVLIVFVISEDESVRELLAQLFEFLVQDLGAGVRVKELAVRDLEFGVAFVEAAAGVDQVVHALELVFVEVGAGDGDEAVYEEVVEVGEGFDDGGARVGGERHAGFEDVVGCWGVEVEDRVHEGHGVWKGGAGERCHLVSCVGVDMMSLWFSV